MAMATEKYKICPACGKKNYPGLVECIECEQDLTHVRITDDETERAALKDDRLKLVRICDNCQAKNPSNARKCSVCGEDIADIVPTEDFAPAITAGVLRGLTGGDVPTDRQTPVTPSTPAAPTVTPAKSDVEEEKKPTPKVPTDHKPDVKEEKKPAPTAKASPVKKAEEGKKTAKVQPTPDTDGVVLPPDRPTVLNPAVNTPAVTVRLSALDHSYFLTLTKETTILGRSEEGSEYLVTKPYVSRKHCALTLTEEGVICEELSGTNYTFVNNQRVMGRVTLKNGDLLSLGGITVGGNRQTHAAYFTVTIV